MFHLQLAWLDGVIKMTDDERTDLKPQEEGEVRKRPEIGNAILPFSRVRRCGPSQRSQCSIPGQSVQVVK